MTPSRLDDHRACYYELMSYTLLLHDAEFVHQHVVDAWGAQHAQAHDKPIGPAFALIGLYLHLEHGFTGRQVQRVHMWLARDRHDWPRWSLPQQRGDASPCDVMAAAPGVPRLQQLEAWAHEVWQAFIPCRQRVLDLLCERFLGGDGQSGSEQAVITMIHTRLREFT